MNRLCSYDDNFTEDIYTCFLSEPEKATKDFLRLFEGSDIEVCGYNLSDAAEGLAQTLCARFETLQENRETKLTEEEFRKELLGTTYRVVWMEWNSDWDEVEAYITIDNIPEMN